MIEHIEVQNVRVFSGQGWHFSMRPLTVLCGTNSSGKSTLLRLPVLLRQSQGIGETFGATGGRLRFVGSQVDLGSYDSLVSDNNRSNEIVIGLTMSDEMPRSVLDELSGVAPPEDIVSSPSRRARITEDDYIAYQLSVTLSFGTAPESAVENTFGWTSSQGVLRRASFTILHSEKPQLTWTVALRTESDTSRPYYSVDIPVEFITRYRFLAVLDGVEPEKSEDGESYRFKTFLDGLLPRALLVPMKEDAKAAWELPLPPVIMPVTSAFRAALSSIRYLSPLRSPAKRYYLTHLDIMPPADPAGDFLPYAFREMSKFHTNYYRPGTDEEVKRGELETAIQEWLGYIRSGKPVKTEALVDEISFETQKVLSELRIRSTIGEKMHPLVDSGFGYSQLLPIVILGLSASTDSTILVEQPELHLNPALQVRLAEFFVSLIRSGKQVIIETHSEHIVNTIRAMAAEDESGWLSQRCQVTYLDSDDAGPRVHELSIQEDGSIPNLPASFFGEAMRLTARMLKAQRRLLAKHKEQR